MMSAKLSPAASTCTRDSPLCWLGGGMSFRVKASGPPKWVITIAFIRRSLAAVGNFGVLPKTRLSGTLECTDSTVHRPHPGYILPLNSRPSRICAVGTEHCLLLLRIHNLVNTTRTAEIWARGRASGSFLVNPPARRFRGGLQWTRSLYVPYLFFLLLLLLT